jgi:hypothetical protein
MYIDAIASGKRFRAFITKDWKSFKRECLQNKFSNLKYSKVENNNPKILTNISKGLYIDHNKLEKCENK